MKRKSLQLLLLLWFFNSAGALAQEMLWEEISYTSSRLAMRFYDRAEHDSVRAVLSYWEHHCGLSEPLLRIKMLHAIERGEFSEDLFNEKVIGLLLEYREKIFQTDNLEEAPWSSIHYPLDGGTRIVPYLYEGFNYFTFSLANRLADSLQTNAAARFFTGIYSNRFPDVLPYLQSEEFAYTAVREYYDRELSKALNRPELHFGLVVGRWMPRGKLARLGNHPSAGVSLGGKWKHYLLDLSFIFKYRNASSGYWVEREDGERVLSSHFYGGYIGMDIGRELLRRRRYEVDLLGGIAVDGFDTILPSADDRDGQSIFTTNLNAGLGLRYFFPPFQSAYIGMQLRYNLVDYNNPGGSDLSGNVLTLRFQIGLLGGAGKPEMLEKLRYQY